mmetsp:Transcript_95344/g.253291  ORF Transcript_95344/g.253291 Transcript_95344/m.253291 type:complete len:217 (-) Transcript_95344:28-678(-)
MDCHCPLKPSENLPVCHWSKRCGTAEEPSNVPESAGASLSASSEVRVSALMERRTMSLSSAASHSADFSTTASTLARNNATSSKTAEKWGSTPDACSAQDDLAVNARKAMLSFWNSTLVAAAASCAAFKAEPSCCVSNEDCSSGSGVASLSRALSPELTCTLYWIIADASGALSMAGATSSFPCTRATRSSSNPAICRGGGLPAGLGDSQYMKWLE